MKKKITYKKRSTVFRSILDALDKLPNDKKRAQTLCSAAIMLGSYDQAQQILTWLKESTDASK